MKKRHFTISKIVSGQYVISMGWYRSKEKQILYFTQTHAEAKSIQKVFQTVYQAGVLDERIRSSK